MYVKVYFSFNTRLVHFKSGKILIFSLINDFDIELGSRNEILVPHKYFHTKCKEPSYLKDCSFTMSEIGELYEGIKYS